MGGSTAGAAEEVVLGLKKEQLEIELQMQKRLLNQFLPPYCPLVVSAHHSMSLTALSFPQNTADFLVPPMSIHTLIENAVKHGTRNEEGKLNIHASAMLKNKDKLVILVSQPGNFFLANLTKSSGGLMLVRQHLTLLFGEEANLTLREHPPGTVTAEMQLPTRRA